MTSEALAHERVMRQDKMLRYIAFVLTGDEAADPQQAADGCAQALAERDERIALLRTRYDTVEGICATAWKQCDDAQEALATMADERLIHRDRAEQAEAQVEKLRAAQHVCTHCGYVMVTLEPGA